ncbi:SDR family NAD(P)-dependent oxidoreductase [Pseudoalteromonas sp. JBTF-M23]|uniref:SDR family NAD(P)-dependent oxidoreductase n=1 Tax=Pseudoalteromonas caenipelagi TaxID=2726988 RepID=A0A849VCV3_9GAMM|nr:type I polyketide synthase [Pseudoalteromonas caenipelagi]NOU50885.1 SDR family NAD(P)-dependent oxidoreductase [Pseudoalteromonas caenipelagi]
MNKTDLNKSVFSNKNDIAVIGVACRLPGDNNHPTTFHEFLLNGGNGISTIPEDRWSVDAYYDSDKTAQGKMYVKKGGFLSGLSQFDATFFGISPKEAPYIDPQHRWLLEVSYEAMENAGLDTKQLKGSDTGVFIGQFMHDFEQLQTDSNAHAQISNHSATGSSMTLTANRLSYCYDFHGPSLTLDTACSSSLVALDLACKAIQNGDSQIALAGGVNLLLRPEMTMSICKASMLSPDGLCKSFDSSANGYVRSEGVAVAVLKSLSQAITDNDPILAVIKASGTNQDGHTSGITVPNGQAQQQLLKKTLAIAGLNGSDIDYAEAHGTGTAVGDPIEVNALGKALGKDLERAKDNPCLIGSVKSNIGHTEPTAGLAGLIKTINAINSGMIPKNIHCHTLNPAIDESELNIKIVTKNTPWPDKPGKPRRAIVNSFGFGGTNANVVIEQAPTSYATSNPKTDVLQLFISAKSENALKESARLYLNTAKQLDESQLRDLCINSVLLRTAHRHRLVFSATARSQLIQQLEDYIGELSNKAIRYGQAQHDKTTPIAFVFSGMGTTWPQMGMELYKNNPIFKAQIDKIDHELKKYVSWSLVDVIAQQSEQIHDTQYAQPSIFAIQVALYEALIAQGVRVNAIVGHSAGEVAASYCAGVYNFVDAVKIVYYRSQLQQTTSGEGKMLAVGVDEATAKALCEQYQGLVSIAAINSETAITLSGDSQSLEHIAQQLDEAGQFAKFLNVDVPYHSPAMEKLKQPLIAALADIQPQPPIVPMYSTVTGLAAQWQSWTGEYWADNVRDPVYFYQAIQQILADGIECFIEVAPHAVLSHSIKQISTNPTTFATPTLSRAQDDRLQLAACVASLATAGLMDVATALAVNNCKPNHSITLPNYPWQHESYWLENPDVQLTRIENKQKKDAYFDTVLPLLGQQLISQQPVWQSKFDLAEQAFLSGHQVGEDIIYPGAGYIESALQLARLQWPDGSIELKDIEFLRPLFVEPTANILETRLNSQTAQLTIHSFKNDDWHLQAQCQLNQKPNLAVAGMPLQQAKLAFATQLDQAAFYQQCHQLGMNYQNQFQSVTQCYKDERTVLVELNGQENTDYILDPTLLDGAFQSFFQLVEHSYLPVKIATVRVHKTPSPRCFAKLTVAYINPVSSKGDIDIFDIDGRLCVQVQGIELRSNTAERHDPNTELKYHYTWANLSIAEGLPEVQSHPATLLLSSEHPQQLSDLPGIISSTPLSVASLETELSQQTAHIQRVIIDLRSLSHVTLSNLSAEIDQQQAFVQPLQVLQALQAQQWQKALEIVLITQGAYAPSQCTVEPTQTALWGLGRVFASENQQFNTVLLDLDDNQSSQQVLQHLLQQSQLRDAEIAIHQGAAYSHQLQALTTFACLNDTLYPVLPSEPNHYQWQFVDEQWLAIKQPLSQEHDLAQVHLIATSPHALTGQLTPALYLLTDNHDNPLLSVAFEGLTSYLDTDIPLISLANGKLDWLTNNIAAVHNTLALQLGIEALNPRSAIAFYAPSHLADLATVRLLKSSGHTVHIIEEEQLEQFDGLIETLIWCSDTIPSSSLAHKLQYGAHVISLKSSISVTHLPDNCSFIRPTLTLAAQLSKAELTNKLSNIVDTLTNFDTPSGTQTIEMPNIPSQELSDAVTISMAQAPKKLYQRQNTSTPFKEASYLVTGGQGGIGLEVVQWLIKQGASQVFVTGRSALNEQLASVINRAREHHCTIEYIQADISQREDVTRLMSDIQHASSPLKGIFHAAGVLKDATFSQQSPEHMSAVLAPKVNGAWYLHQATLDSELDYFVCFSSIAAMVGWAGQANYATANAFMDGLCAARKQQGLNATSLNWGPWLEAGMAAQLAEHERLQMERSGMYALSSLEGVTELEHALSCATAQIGIFKVDWQNAKLVGSQPSARSVYTQLLPEQTTDTENTIKTQLTNASSSQRSLLLVAAVKTELAGVLGLSDPEHIEVNTSVFDYGLNSLMAIDLKQRLQAFSDSPLPASIVMKHDSVSKLAEYIGALYNEATQSIDQVSEEQVVTVTL